MEKLEARFFKVSISGKSGPLLLLVNDYVTSHDREDYRVYWSFTEKFPCLEDSDGEFSSYDWVMNIPFTASAKNNFIYFGVYSYNHINTQIACSFGANTGKVLSSMFIAEAEEV
jgi:hypothetical protein